ncbi:acyltransferase family protein [Kineococcus rhizosphaerae]|uniref:Putative membrane protein YcfT n=1 Tax=Kineococcus rhizosphaerae TaxID=559628 RepID=A0A2T0RAA1_9ACTN|nr:acyltransferase family protein [Kineococcus rhizosphaerae]PRY18098.1 putative membrane protein YcfT [Kineococcus rhizosphaerae]
MPPTVRLSWIDTARGAAIVLVMVHHAVLFAGAEGLAHHGWTAVDETLRLLRMPLFFFLSGLLAVRAVHRPWPDLLRRRITGDLWVYLLWATAAFTVFTLVPYHRDPLPAGPRGWLEQTLLLPGNGAWYLLALALYLLAGRLLRTVPTRLLLPAAALVSAAFGPGPLVQYSFVWNDVLTLFVFFAAGLRLRDLTLAATARTPGWTPTLAATAAVGALALTVTALSLVQVPGVRLLVGATAVAAGTLLAVRLADTAPGRLLAGIGARTLPVYVTHEIVLGLLVLALATLDAGPLLTLTAPVLLVAAALAVCLPLRTPLSRLPWALNAPWAAPRQREVRPTTVPQQV